MQFDAFWTHILPGLEWAEDHQYMTIHSHDIQLYTVSRKWNCSRNICYFIYLFFIEEKTNGKVQNEQFILLQVFNNKIHYVLIFCFKIIIWQLCNIHTWPNTVFKWLHAWLLCLHVTPVYMYFFAHNMKIFSIVLSFEVLTL